MKKVLLLLLLILRQQYALEREAQAIRAQKERGKICILSLNSQTQSIFSTESVDTTTVAAVGTKAGIY